MVKKEYLRPDVEIVHVVVEESILAGSKKGTGANISWSGSEEDFGDFFN